MHLDYANISGDSKVSERSAIEIIMVVKMFPRKKAKLPTEVGINLGGDCEQRRTGATPGGKYARFECGYIILTLRKNAMFAFLKRKA